MKKLIFLLITIFMIYLIYNTFKVNKINYVSISDINIDDSLINREKLANYNSFNTKSLVSAYQDIQNNKTIKVNNKIYYLKKVLRESDVLVLSIGMNELSKNYDKYNMDNNYQIFNKMYDNIEKLISELKKYAFGKIMFIGFYNPTNYYDANTDRFFYDINIRLERLMMDNNVIYIDLYELIKENNYKTNTFYLNNNGYRKLTSIINFYL